MEHSEFVAWDRSSPFLDAVGGFRRHFNDPLRIGFSVDGAKVNGRGFFTPARSPTSSSGTRSLR